MTDEEFRKGIEQLTPRQFEEFKRLIKELPKGTGAVPKSADVPVIEKSRSEIANDARHQALRRAAEIIRVLREGSEQSNYVFDEERAKRFLENLCLLDDEDDEDPKFHQIIEWVSDHNQ